MIGDSGLAALLNGQPMTQLRVLKLHSKLHVYAPVDDVAWGDEVDLMMLLSLLILMLDDDDVVIIRICCDCCYYL